MAVEYGIKAHPTIFGARQFRSRLEAKWASFFDLAGWQFEYEPFDLDGWSPDFLLKGRESVLVEVKPISAPDEDTQRKMEMAANKAGWKGELLLVGIAPLFDMDFGPYESPALGWLAERGWAFPDFSATKSMLVGFDRECWARASAFQQRHKGPPDFMHAAGAYYGRMSGINFKKSSAFWPADSDWLKRLWDRAANRVQWRPA